MSFSFCAIYCTLSGLATIHQILMYGFETFLAIVIVCIDDDKRSLDDLLRCKHSLTSSPRFCAAFWQSSRDIIDILESILYKGILKLQKRLSFQHYEYAKVGILNATAINPMA